VSSNADYPHYITLIISTILFTILCLHFKNVEVTTPRTKFSPVRSHGMKPISPSLEEHGLKTAPTRKLRKIGRPKSKEGQEVWQVLIMSCFVICINHYVSLLMINCGSQNEMDAWIKKNTLVGKYACKWPRGRPHINGQIIMKYTLKIKCVQMWTRLNWIRWRSSGELWAH